MPSITVDCLTYIDYYLILIMQVTDNLSNSYTDFPRTSSEERFHQTKSSGYLQNDVRERVGHISVIKDVSSSSGHTEKGHKTYNFQNIQTCSNSKMSHREERISNNEENVKTIGIHDDNNSSKRTKRSSIQGLNLYKDQISETSVENKGFLRKLRENSNSLEIKLPSYQKQQNQSESSDQQDLKITEKTIVRSTHQSNRKSPGLSPKVIADSIETVKNLDLFHEKLDFQTDKEHNGYDICGDLEKSSCSSEHKNEVQQIWNQNFYELQDVQALKEKEVESSEEEDEVYFIQTTKPLNKQYDELFNDNETLRLQNQQLKIQLTHLERQKHTLQEQNTQNELLLSQFNERQVQLSQENQQLNSLILDYKKAEYNYDLTLKEYKSKMTHLEHELHQCHKTIDTKQDQIQVLMNSYEEKVQDNEDAIFAYRELEDLLEAKHLEYETKKSQLCQEINELKETVDFYKARLEEEGFTLNLDEIKRIKEIFQNQADHEQNIINNLSKEYSESLAKLQQQNNLYASQISVLKDKTNQAFSEHYDKHFSILTSQTQSIIDEYDNELEVRDEQILKLKKKLTDAEQIYKEININYCKTYLGQVQQLSRLILKQQIQKYSHPELVIEFIYVVDKLCRMFSIAEKKISWIDEEKRKIMSLMTAKSNLYLQETKEMRFKLTECELEKIKIKDQNERLQVKIKQFEKLKGETKGQRYQTKNDRYNTLKNVSKNYSKPDCIETSRSTEGNYMTLEQLLKTHNLTFAQKIRLSLALIQFAKGLLRDSKKHKSIKPNLIEICIENQLFSIKYSHKQTEKGLIYSAPQVLLGFSESQNSYVWTLGLILDFLFHGSLFYKKINEVTSRAQNYYCRDQELTIRKALESMLKKKQKERCTLDDVKTCMDFLQ